MKIIQIFIWIGFSTILYAQTNKPATIPFTVRKGIVFKRELTFDASVHTNGFFIGFNKGKIKNYHTTNFLHFDLGFLYHPNETRSSRNNNSGFKSFNAYKFGKQNQLINLRLGRGIIYTLTEKARTKGIAIGLRLEGGFNLGLLKPYYLKLYEEHDGRPYVVEKKFSEGDDSFLDPNSILGSASFFKGFDELSIIPGAYGRIAVRFDLGAYEKMAECLEAGIQLDLYSKRPSIMVNDANPQTFINFFINLQLGMRKT